MFIKKKSKSLTQTKNSKDFISSLLSKCQKKIWAKMKTDYITKFCKKKKPLFQPVQNKLSHAFRVCLIFFYHFNLKYLLFVLLMPNSQSHLFRKSLSILALLINFFEIAYIFQHIRNTITNFKPVFRKYFQHIDMEILTYTWPILIALKLFGLLKQSTRLHHSNITF